MSKCSIELEGRATYPNKRGDDSIIYMKTTMHSFSLWTTPLFFIDIFLIMDWYYY